MSSRPTARVIWIAAAVLVLGLGAMVYLVGADYVAANPVSAWREPAAR